jgi:hypothetical protein
MDNRAGGKTRLGHPEQRLDLEEIAAAAHRLKWGDAGIGAQAR